MPAALFQTATDQGLWPLTKLTAWDKFRCLGSGQ